MDDNCTSNPILLPLEPLLLNELRLSIMALLRQVEEVDFTYLKEVTGATAGNISVQIDKLSTAGFIEVEKGYQGKRPRTVCRITPKGIDVFVKHFEALKSYLTADDAILKS